MNHKAVVAGLAFSVALLVGSYFLVVAPYWERRPLENQLRAIPGVEFVRAWGDRDAGISAAVALEGGGSIELEGLSEEAFFPNGTVFVGRVGNLAALTVACPTAQNDVSRGPVWSYSFGLHQNGVLGELLSPPLRNVPDAVERYAGLQRLFESAPRCPQKDVAPGSSRSWKIFYCVKAVGVGEHPSVSELNCGAV